MVVKRILDRVQHLHMIRTLDHDMSNLMLENAHHMGPCEAANSQIQQLHHLKLDWGDGWDGSFSGYTVSMPFTTVHLGPHHQNSRINQESYYAGRNAVLGELISSAKPRQAP